MGLHRRLSLVGVSGAALQLQLLIGWLLVLEAQALGTQVSVVAVLGSVGCGRQA